jgi:hypothetical protein
VKVCRNLKLQHKVRSTSDKSERSKTRSREIAVLITEIGQQFFMRSRSVVSRVSGEQTLIVPLRAKVGDLASIYSFSGTGSLIWDLLEAPKAIPELVHAVERECRIDTEQAQRDVVQFVDEMFSVGLIEVCPMVAMAAIEPKAQMEWETASSR